MNTKNAMRLTGAGLLAYGLFIGGFQTAQARSNLPSQADLANDRRSSIGKATIIGGASLLVGSFFVKGR